MVIVLASIYAFLLHLLHMDLVTDISVRTVNAPNDGEAAALNISDWMGSHYALTRLLSIPFLALGTWICFLRQGYNFVEYLVFSAFITAQSLVFLIITLPLYYYFRDSEWFNIFNYAAQLALVLWTFMQLFNKLSKFRIFIQSLGTLLLYTLFMVIFGIIAVLIASLFAFS